MKPQGSHTLRQFPSIEYPWYGVRPTLALMAAVSLILITVPTFAASETNDEVAWGFMGMNLFGGLALFLYGMEKMADALKAVAGERMKLILAKLTTNRFMGAATGAFVTAVIQSSSITTVLVVGFISAGLMSMAQSIGVIMGANIGTTVTAQIVAFKVTKAALLMIAVGFGMLFVSKQERIRQYGSILMGLGMVFFGMAVMSEAMKPLRSYQPFLDLMITMENPVIGILIAATFTGLIQSSSATTGVVIVMASQGFITLPAGIALAFGANIGTCVTALLASIGKPREAVRAAVVHILFNVAGVLIWIAFIPQLAALVTWLSPIHPDLSGAVRLAAETPRQIANAHTIFNITNTLIFIWFTAQMGRLVEWMVPDRPLEKEGVIIRPKYLDAELLATPSLALDRVRLEVLHIGEYVQRMLSEVMPAISARDRNMLEGIQNMDDQVDILHGHSIEYLGKISKTELTEDQTKEFVKLMEAVNNLENIGDVIETDLVGLGNKLIDENIRISDSTEEVLRNIHTTVSKSVDAAIQAVSQSNEIAAQVVTNMKDDITRLTESAAMHEARRLVAEEPNRIPAYTIEMDIIEKLKRIYYFAKRMAKTVTPQILLQKSA
ncbi:MAG: Na/Pi cotransporter family protein [Gammaproteobacteria bacterium]|nr:Na/Pi cotransporter family protein [Gammaproteobacteria bacterium]